MLQQVSLPLGGIVGVARLVRGAGAPDGRDRGVRPRAAVRPDADAVPGLDPGGGQLAAAEIVRRGLVEPIPIEQVAAPGGARERREWLVEGARMLAGAVREAGPERPVWTWQSDRLDTAATLSRPELGMVTPFAGLVGSGEVLQFVATDAGLGPDGEWSVTRGPAGVTWRGGRDRALVTVPGPALRLLLLLNRRLPVEAAGVEVSGRRELLAHWLANSRF